MSTVTVQIVTYNNSLTIEQTLRSTLNQTDISFNVLVIDNASTDETLEIVKSMGVTVVENTRNTGYSAAHNQAIRLSSSPYILTLNPDVRLTSNFLSCVIKELEKDTRLGSASGCLLRVAQLDGEPRVIDSAGLYMKRNRRQGLRYEGEPVSRRPTEPASIFGPDGAAAVYRRAMLEDIADNGEVFDEDFFMHKEDVDVCWRALSRGWQSCFVPGAIAHHIRTFRPGQRESVDLQTRFYGIRNRYLLLLKNESWSSFWRDAPYILFYDLGVLGYMLLREQASLRALSSAWQLRHRMLNKRKVIQARTQVDWSFGLRYR